MTGDQTFAAIIIGISAFSLVSLGKRLFDHFDKKHAQDIDLQKAKANTEKDKQMIDAFSKTVETVARLRQTAMADLIGIEEGTALTYSGEELSLPELKERTTAAQKQKESDISTIKGSYRIARLHFNFEANSARADIYNVNTTESLTSVEIQPRSIIDGTFAVLKKAQDKEDVDLQIIIRKKDDKIVKATLDKIL